MGDVERVCHQEQMTVWVGEIVGALSMAGVMRDDLSYDEVIEVHQIISDEIKRIIENAFDHPELNSTPNEAGYDHLQVNVPGQDPRTTEEFERQISAWAPPGVLTSKEPTE